MTPQPENTSCICGKPDCRIPYGFCHCGCGQKTPIEKVNRWNLVGHVKGKPVPRVQGHGGDRSRRFLTKSIRRGRDQCQIIFLTKGKEAVILKSDYEDQGIFLWYAHRSSSTSNFYAARKKKVNGKMTRVFLHREILGLPPGEPSQGDHKNGDTLDCRRKNLRPATQQQNSKNRKKYKNNTSGYKGAYANNRTGKWTSSIFLDGKNRHLGTFLTPQDAHAAYCAAAKKYYGKFARFK